MRFFPSPRSCSVLVCVFLSATSCFSRGDEISFSETYVEKWSLEAEEVVASGTSTLEITLPFNGVNVDEFTGNTGISISLGDFAFDQILDGGEAFFEPGVRSARFRETDFDNDGNEVDAMFIDVTWNTKTFTISGVFRNFSNSSTENYFGVPSHRDVAGSFAETNTLFISFGDLDTNLPVVISGRTVLARRVIDEEEFFLNNIQLSGTAQLPPNDTNAPSVSITSPVSNGRITSPIISGKASDDRGVAEVYFRVGADDFALASGTTTWTANISVQPGTNIVQVKSVDFGGNESPVLSRTFFYAVPRPITIEVNNPAWGTTSITNGQLLDIAKGYTIKAIPARGFLFQDWTGFVNSTNPIISFVMSEDFLLQPNFVPNPFSSIQGTYNGLFSDPNGTAAASAGFFTLTIKESGAFSGKVFLSGKRLPVSGRFNLDGQAAKIIARRGQLPLNLQLQLNFDGTLSGQVAQGEIASSLSAKLARPPMHGAKTNYTLLIPPGNDPATTPGGYGFGRATVNLKGGLRFVGKLSDGSPFSQSTAVSVTGHCPLFASLYRGKGVLSGWLTFGDEPETDLLGDITWTKTAGASGRIYPAGFVVAGAIIGSVYNPPDRNDNVFQNTNLVSGSLEFNGGNLLTSLSNNFVLGSSSRFTLGSTNKAKLAVSRATGLLRGSFTHPDTHKRTPLHGVILQKSNWGAGFFLGTNQSGYFLLQPSLD